MTADEFERSPYAETYELIRGELYSIVPAGTLHGIITNRLSALLTVYVLDKGLGEVAAAETGFRLDSNSVVGADIAFVSREQLDRFGIPDSYFPVAPALAVEVVSQSNTSDEIATKVEGYLKSGSRMVWVVYPKRKVVVVYRTNNTVSFLHETDELVGEEVLPGFSCPLEKIFGGLPEAVEDDVNA